MVSLADVVFLLIIFDRLISPHQVGVPYSFQFTTCWTNIYFIVSKCLFVCFCLCKTLAPFGDALGSRLEQNTQVRLAGLVVYGMIINYTKQNYLLRLTMSINSSSSELSQRLDLASFDKISQASWARLV